MTDSLREHFERIIGQVVDPRATASRRAANARTAAETAADLRDVYLAGRASLAVGRVADWFDARSGDQDARIRQDLREQLPELRDLVHLPGLLASNVVWDGATGYGPAPLVRSVAAEWQSGLLGGASVVPGFKADNTWAEVDPDLSTEVEPDAATIIDDVSAADGRHMAVAVVRLTKQLDDWLTPEGRRMLDQLVYDDVDLAAEQFIAGELITAAAGTRAAGADLGAALDDAEGAAGGRGLAQWLVVSPLDWPTVRRQLAGAFFDGPHPEVAVSAGQPTGTATVLGPGGVLLMANDHMEMSANMPRIFGKSIAVARPFYLQVRDDAAIQTVTGIGA